jgi:hypothetical protein
MMQAIDRQHEMLSLFPSNLTSTYLDHERVAFAAVFHLETQEEECCRPSATVMKHVVNRSRQAVLKHTATL